MKLPNEIFNYEQTWQDLELQFSKKKIRIRKYLTREVRQYLNNTSTIDSDWNRNYEAFKLFKACLHPEDVQVADEICKADFIYAISYLRSMSFDPSIARPHNCPHCGWFIENYDIMILKNITFEPSEPEYNVEFETEDGVKIVFKPIPYIKELELIKNKKEEEYFEVAQTIVYYSVDKLVIDGVAYEDIDIEEIKKFMDEKVHPKDYKKMLEFITDKKIVFYIQEKLECPECGKEYFMRVDEPYFFVQV